MRLKEAKLVPILRVGSQKSVPSYRPTRVRVEKIGLMTGFAAPREHASDGQQPCHLPGFEDSALRIHEGYPLAAELEPAREIGGIQHIASWGSEPVRTERP